MLGLFESLIFVDLKKRIVEDFATEMKFGLDDLQTKIKDLSTALKTRLDLNKEDVLQAGCLTVRRLPSLL